MVIYKISIFYMTRYICSTFFGTHASAGTAAPLSPENCIVSFFQDENAKSRFFAWHPGTRIGDLLNNTDRLHFFKRLLMHFVTFICSFKK